MAATVPVVGVRALVRALERLSLPTQPLLADVGIDPAALDDPDGRVSSEQADALWVAAYRASDDDRLAMRAVQQLRLGDYRTLTYLAANCPTLGHGVRRMLGFFDLVDRRIRWTLDEGTDPIVLGLSFEGLADPLPRAPVEYTLGAFVVSLRLATGLDWRPQRVEVGFADPGGEAAAEHRSVLGAMTYQAPATQLIIPGFWWRHALPQANGPVADMLHELARRQLREIPADDDIRTRLRQVIGGSLVGGPPGLGHAARALALSERSLQRRLGEAGTTFRDEIDAARRVTAHLLLEDPTLALSEVSWLLGFSDPRAFTRAFRRWRGVTPSTWRRNCVDAPRGGR